MPVTPPTQMAIAQRYGALTDSITHARAAVERQILAPHFHDRGRVKLEAFTYDPLTVLVQNIDARGDALVVHAQWVGIGSKRENTVDRWVRIDGAWRLLERDALGGR